MLAWGGMAFICSGSEEHSNSPFFNQYVVEMVCNVVYYDKQLVQRSSLHYHLKGLQNSSCCKTILFYEFVLLLSDSKI